MRTTMAKAAGLIAIGLAVLVSGSFAKTKPEAPRPPAPVIDPALDQASLQFAGADFRSGAGMFIDPASVDRSHSDNVQVRTITVLRDPGLSGAPRYERSAFAINCAGDRPNMERLSRTQIARSGETIGEANKAGGTESGYPGSAGLVLWQTICGHGANDGVAVAGVAGAIALFDPQQEAADDIRRNGGTAARADDPGRALYLDTRHREIAAASPEEVTALIPDYERAADAGSRQASWRLVEITRSDTPNATRLTWLRKPADGGDAQAQVELALALIDAQPCTEARAYLEKSAAQGNAEAQTRLGDDLARGTCGPKDRDQAFSWTEKAAHQGYFEGQFQLGKMYEAGVGVEPSAIEAGAWYRIATGHSAQEPEAGIYVYSAMGATYRTDGVLMYENKIPLAVARARELCRLDDVCKLVVKGTF